MALYAEAAPFIAQMKLKRVNDSGKFVLYQDEAGEAILAVTGPGKVEAAVAVSYVCAKYGTDESTFILNIGSAAGAPLFCRRARNLSIFSCREAGLFVSAERFRKPCQRGKAVFQRLFVAGVANAHALGLLEAIAGRDERARLIIEPLAELIRRHVKIVIDQRRCAGLGLGVVKMRIFGDPCVQNREILAHDGPVAAQKRVRVAKGESGDRVVKHPAAN